MARLLSVNVGLPGDIAWKGRIVHTGIWKDPVPGRCRVGRLNLDGDGQGDLAGHGGEQRAVFVYQIEAYRYWQEQLKRNCARFLLTTAARHRRRRCDAGHATASPNASPPLRGDARPLRDVDIDGDRVLDVA